MVFFEVSNFLALKNERNSVDERREGDEGARRLNSVPELRSEGVVTLRMTQAQQPLKRSETRFVQPAANIRDEIRRSVESRRMKDAVAAVEIVHRVTRDAENVGSDFRKRSAVRRIFFFHPLTNRGLHVESPLDFRAACTFVRNIRVPIRNLRAAHRVDSVSVHAVVFHIVFRNVFHVFAPRRPIEIEAPIIKRRSIFVVHEPFGVLLCAFEFVASSVRHGVLHHVNSAIVQPLHERFVLVAGSESLLKFVIIARPINPAVLNRKNPNRVRAGFCDSIDERNRGGKSAQILQIASDPPSWMKSVQKKIFEFFRSIGRDCES